MMHGQRNIKIAMKIRVSYKAGNLLTSWGSVSLSRRTLLLVTLPGCFQSELRIVLCY